MFSLIVITLIENYSTNEDSSMRIQVMLVLLIIVGNFINYISSTFIKSRTWHEEFVLYKKNQQFKILYPRYKMCRAPREKPEKIKPKSIQPSVKTAEVSWAELLTIYSADSGAEIYNWDFWKKKADPNKANRFHHFLSLAKTMGAILFTFTLFIFIVPVVGKFGFHLYSLVWLVIFHPEMRRICRRIYITKEKISRRHMRLLIPKTGDKSQQKRKQFRLPFILREYNEEEVPAELMLSGEDDTDGEVSSDGFENLLIRTKTKGTAQSKPYARNLVHLMATTEEELARTESDSVFIESTADSSTRADFLHSIRSRSVSSKPPKH